ncbi:hypothetical protein [Rhizobium sp. GN54]|uniref:hypothetical protein n=1 Tax=Rhizobium sp. GN54 TaxID=2898150 RepID=UPI001E366F18|nr:hypothetical protein [Rhizobium sp. GN54]MCD2183315.1 hypothetical protein [Rhizobium sp. GN54]
MTPVTLPTKCYIHACAACGCLFETGRSDALTCSGACRVRAKRNGTIQRLQAVAEGVHVSAGAILRARALDELCPEHAASIISGEKTFDDLTTTIQAAFAKRARQAAAVQEGA